MNKPSISLCMIAKNEEAWIGRSIASVRSIVSEVILVDTGSEDQTVQIGESLGAKIFHEPWGGDFSHARNISIEKASGEWILVLDADELIHPSDLAQLAGLTSDRRVCWEFAQRHYSSDYRLSNFLPVRGEFPDYEQGNSGYFESSLVRLFPNKEGILYKGKVHELVEHSIRELGRFTVKHSPIRIHHYGHTEAVKKQKNKGSLYTPLGQAKVAENPADWKNQFELGVEHNNNGRLLESEAAFIESMRLNPTYLSTLVNLGYVQCELKKYVAATETLRQALKLHPRSEEAYCNLGVVFMRTGDFARAERALRNAIACNADYVNAYNNLAISLAQLGRLSEAAQILFRIREIFPSSEHAAARLRDLYTAVGLPEVAAKF